jgi:hypothetical protein
MLLRAILSVLLTAGLMGLVVWQIRRTAWPFNTVETMGHGKEFGISIDRHYAMSLDFCVIAPFVGLCVFLCAPQWSLSTGSMLAVISALVIAVCLWLWKDGNEAHAHDGRITEVGWVHAFFAFVAVWAFVMVLFGTARPDPVLLLIMSIVVPAFLFVGQHMFLALIDYEANAYTFDDTPLSEFKGWAILIIATAVVWWRAWVLIPSSFWNSIQ